MRKHFRKPLVMSKYEEEMFNASTSRYICGEQYKEKDVRVRDHCHVTGKYTGSAHQECNLKLNLNPNNVKIPVIFHNLRGYDTHFIMKEIGKIGKEKNLGINCIPNNMDRYMDFMLGNNLVFLDSFQFISCSLDRLAANLPDDKYKYTLGVFKNEQLALVKKNGVYHYDFVDGFDKFGYKELPTKEELFSMLTQEGITNE